MRNKRKKGFTIIELIVVIAILGILVLLAYTNFSEKKDSAILAVIVSEISLQEKNIEAELVKKEDYMEDWESVSNYELNSFKNHLFNRKGLITIKNDTNSNNEIYYKIPEDLVKTSKLKGVFYISKNREVYYHDKNLATRLSKSAVLSDIDLKLENSFEWIKDPNGYLGLNEEKGYFKYTGTSMSKVEIPSLIQGVFITSTYKMFEKAPKNLETVVSNNENIINTSWMFYKSESLNLDLSYFDTSNVQDVSYMFYYSKAKSIKLDGKFNTSNVEIMNEMFSEAGAESLNLKSFDTSKVKNMASMFWKLPAKRIDVSSFDTSNVENMSYMFYGTLASDIIFSEKFNTKSTENMIAMFSNSSANCLNLSFFNTSKLNRSRDMFTNAKATIGYAKTQEDANKLNSTVGKPTGLKFVVKTL